MSGYPDATWWPLLWDAGVVALAVLGPDRRYQAVNAAWCRRLEGDAATILGWSYERVGHPLDLDVELDAFVRLAEGAASTTYRRRFRTVDGQEFTAEVHAIAGAEDTVLQLLVPATAPPQPPAREKELLEQVAAALSHDAQEPVRQLGVSAGLVMDRLEPLLSTQERELSLLQGMERNAVRLNRQLRGLVRFARVGPTRIDPALQPLRPLVDAAMAQVAVPETIRVDNSIAATVQVRCDRAQLVAALVELLRNACAPHAPGRPTTVTFAAGGDERQLIISVRDDGVGITMVDQPRLFRLFAASGPGAGAGIGLALVRAIAEGHGGSVRLESTPGVGTTVSFSLPR